LVDVVWQAFLVLIGALSGHSKNSQKLLSVGRFPRLDFCADVVNGSKVHDLILDHFVLAAIRMNDRFSRRLAAQDFTRMQQFPCCESTQRTT
jgi:hypothetical protein